MTRAALHDDSIRMVTCIVRSQSGAYLTNSVRGIRASCTYSADMAAERLACKLFHAGWSMRLASKATGLASTYYLEGRPRAGVFS